jgi:phosphoribosylamine-glycine ligase
MSLKDKHVLVYDLGLFTEQSLRLLRDCAEVKYFIPWVEAFPELFKEKVGEGLDGLERVDYFWDHVDKADFIFAPDTHSSDIVQFLRRHDYPVAGVGSAERIEQDRWYGRTQQKNWGLPVQETHRIKGVDALLTFCKEHKDYFIKIDTFRGIEESFLHLDFRQSEGTIYKIAHKLGPYKEDIIFICEEKLEGVEPGIDAITWEGEIMYPAMFGYESVGIVERTCMSPDEMPVALQLIDEGLSPLFKEHELRFFYSAEIRLGKDRLPYLIDPTLRMAAPGTSAIQCELFENFSQVIYGLATGEKIKPIIKHKYSAAMPMHTEEGGKEWINISFPQDMRQWIKLRMAVKKGKDYYSVPGFDSVGTVIGFGNTVKEAIEQVKERIKDVKAKRLNKDVAGFDEIYKQIEEGKQYGINF